MCRKGGKQNRIVERFSLWFLLICQHSHQKTRHASDSGIFHNGTNIHEVYGTHPHVNTYICISLVCALVCKSRMVRESRPLHPCSPGLTIVVILPEKARGENGRHPKDSLIAAPKQIPTSALTPHSPSPTSLIRSPVPAHDSKQLMSLPDLGFLRKRRVELEDLRLPHQEHGDTGVVIVICT